MWLARRRSVDDAVAHLTRYGPAASDQVHHHLLALRQLLDQEAEAFAVLEAAAPEVAQKPLPLYGEDDDTVISLTDERSRRSRQPT